MFNGSRGAFDQKFWMITHAAAPTGVYPHVLSKVTKVLDSSWKGPHSDQPIEDQLAEVLDKAGLAYGKIRDNARATYQARGSLRALLDFVRGEPLTLKDHWIQDVLITLLMARNDAKVAKLIRALRPPRPKPSADGDPQKAQAYYRWIVARISERVLSGEARTVSQAIREVGLFSEEAEAKWIAAGLRNAGENRVRHIYYDTNKRYVWRTIVMSGLKLFEGAEDTPV